jgi:hypothetical protein
LTDNAVERAGRLRTRSPLRSDDDGAPAVTSKDMNMNSQELINALPTFAVSSAGTVDAIAPLVLQSAAQTIPLLAQLAAQAVAPLEPAPVETFVHTDAARQAGAQLKALLDRYGSDKASQHEYHHLYGSILQSPSTITALLEIGLGTNNEDVVSNMGRTGRPGASLRAFRDFLPNAQIYGADVDPRVLFEEERIRTFHVDQLQAHTMDELARHVAPEFDLIIDDGLHTPGANLATLLFALPRLKPTGVFVVEDVDPGHFPVWQVTAALLLASQYKCFLATACCGSLFAVQRVAG